MRAFNTTARAFPVLLCAGVAPSTLESSIAGSRTKFINWHQDVPDPCSAVRNYTRLAQSVRHRRAHRERRVPHAGDGLPRT